MEDLDVNISIWSIFMTATLQAAVHLGIDYAENLHSAKNQPKRTVQQLFNVSSKLIKDPKEIQGIFGKGQLFILTRQFSYQMQKPKYSPTQYCVWEGSLKIPSKHGKRRLIGFRINFKKDNWIESMWSRWSSSGQISQGSLHCRSSPRFKSWWLESKCELEQIQGRIILMSMCNDIVWWEEGNNELCVANSFLVAEYARRNAPGHWSFLGPDRKRSGMELMGQCPWDHDDQLLWKRTSRVSRIQCFGKRRFEVQRKSKVVFSFQWQRRNRGSDFSYSDFRQSAHCVRSSGGYVWTIGLFPNVFRGYG